MLANIKSLYVLKNKIFTYLDETVKLKLAKYNKNLQNHFALNIINYIIFSKKYIEYETVSRTKGKEYDGYNHQLIYIGEYLNGKRNGEGKEYNEKGELIYEGKFINGKKFEKKLESIYDNKNENSFNGECYEKKYYNGNLLFEGNYINKKRNGKGKEYDYYGNIVFEGEYLNDKRWNGKGNFGYNNSTYEFKNGKGYIKEFDWYGRQIFEGEYLNGERWNGKGIEDNFVGEYINGKKYGQLTEYKGIRKICWEKCWGIKNGKVKEYTLKFIFLLTKTKVIMEYYLKVNIYMILEKKEESIIIIN